MKPMIVVDDEGTEYVVHDFIVGKGYLLTSCKTWEFEYDEEIEHYTMKGWC